MKSKIFNVSLIFKDLVVLFCCLSVILILTHCTNQEKKINTPTKTEGKDTLIQQPSIETKIDTSRGVFLIYKFGDSANVVNAKTWYMVKNGLLSKEATYDDILKTYNNAFFYRLLIDPKYATGAVGYQVGDEFVPEDCYLKFKLSFEYFDEKLFKIVLYHGISDEDRITVKDNWRKYWQAYTPQNIQATLDVYSKKYRVWQRRENEFGLAEFSHRNGNTNIMIQNNYYGVSVIYTDLKAERRLKNQEKDNLQKKMEEKNKGI